MKKYLKEIIILLIQLVVFYVLPLFAGPTDMIGLVFLIIILTFILSIIFGFMSRFRYLYPFIVALLFLPSVPIYYNDSALIHSMWYLIISFIGVLIGTFIYKIINKN